MGDDTLDFNSLERRNGLYGFEMLEEDKRRSKDRKVYDIKQLWQRSHEIINLAAQGFKNKDIAEILRITPMAVSATLNGKLGRLKLSEIRQSRDEEAKKNVAKIDQLVKKAIETYHQIFDDETGQVSLKDKKSVADTVMLELSGLRAPTKIQSHSVHTTLTKEEIEEFKLRGLKALESSGITLDINNGESDDSK
jgi:predicted transcriptional regulator